MYVFEQPMCYSKARALNLTKNVEMNLKLNLLLTYQIYAVSNLKTEFSLWNRINYFPSSLRRRNLKTEFSSL